MIKNCTKCCKKIWGIERFPIYLHMKNKKPIDISTVMNMRVISIKTTKPDKNQSATIIVKKNRYKKDENQTNL